jgi:hypothetical protein
MSNLLTAFVASLAGIAAFYLLEGLYYEAKARYNGNQYIKFLEDIEDEHWDD